MSSHVTGMPALDAPRVPPADRYGPVINTTGGLGEIDGLVGGAGRCRWKQLINGMHLPGGWGCVEYVLIPPGAGCGAHLHAAREEIYYIISGTADLDVNGTRIRVTAGDLLTFPLGTLHAISVPEGAAELALFVIEGLAGTRPALDAPPPARIPMPSRMRDCSGYRGGGHLQDTRVAQVDLSRYLTGSWAGFTAFEIPPGDELGPARQRGGISEVLFVCSGDAEIAAGQVRATGSAGLCAGIGPGGGQVRVRNCSATEALLVISTEMRT